MTKLEQACAQVERAAVAATRATTSLATATKHLARAAAEGDIGKLRKALDLLDAAEQVVRAEVANARAEWPFTLEAEEVYLREAYQTELEGAAAAEGVKLQERDGRIIAFPSVLRILPEARAVEIDRSRVTALRPGRLVELLKRNQMKKPRFRPEQFLEVLYAAYKLVVGTQGSGATLASVYKALTLMPGSNKDYGRVDFARDLYFLDTSRVRKTRSGSRVSFPSSTGTKGGASNLFTFVGPDGAPVDYYGIKFTDPRA